MSDSDSAPKRAHPVGWTFSFQSNPASADLVINAELENSDTGAGAFIKDGPGTMSLAGGIAHSYTGSTTVTAGTLAGTGSIVGPLIVQAAGTIAPGASTGNFSAGATTIAGTYACEIDGANEDTLVVTGDLILTGSTLNLSVLGGGATEPSYVIATYTGTRTDSFGTVTGLPSGYTLNYNDTLKQIELVAGTTYALWIGGFPGAAGAPGFNQDADGDGIDNGIEHLLGTDPSVSSGGLYQISATANSVTFRHTQTNSLGTDVTKSYEWSSDLVEWKASGAANTGGTTGTIVATTITDNVAPANDVIEVVVTATGTPTAKLFARVVANQ